MAASGSMPRPEGDSTATPSADTTEPDLNAIIEAALSDTALRAVKDQIQQLDANMMYLVATGGILTEGGITGCAIQQVC